MSHMESKTVVSNNNIDEIKKIDLSDDEDNKFDEGMYFLRICNNNA